MATEKDRSLEERFRGHDGTPREELEAGYRRFSSACITERELWTRRP